jgi:hypothetical protein
MRADCVPATVQRLLVMALMLAGMTSEASSKRFKPVAPKKSEVQICWESCDKKRQRTIAACDDPECEQRAQDVSALCKNDCNLSPDEKASRASHREHVLAVKHHPQSTPVWCWAASIAMATEFIQDRTVSDCEVATKLDRVSGGGGFCCDSQNRLRKADCFRGGTVPDMTSVMRSFGLPVVQLNRPLTWDEVRNSIDSGHPIVIALNQLWGGGHAEVIVGYRAPGTLLIDDPWSARLIRPNEVSFLSLAGDGTMADSWRNFRGWKISWVFQSDIVGGAPPPRLVRNTHPTHTAINGAALSTVQIEFPKLDGSLKSSVEKRASDYQPTARACYDDAVSHGTAVPSPAHVRMTFGVENGTPSFVMIKDAGGLPHAVTDCIAEALAEWHDLYPRKGVDDSQTVLMSFERLAP